MIKNIEKFFKSEGELITFCFLSKFMAIKEIFEMLCVCVRHFILSHGRRCLLIGIHPGVLNKNGKSFNIVDNYGSKKSFELCFKVKQNM